MGCIFWNAWYMNYSDYVINVAQIGDASVAGLIGTFSSIGGTIAGFGVYRTLVYKGAERLEYARCVYCMWSDDAASADYTECSGMLHWRIRMSAF